MLKVFVSYMVLNSNGVYGSLLASIDPVPSAEDLMDHLQKAAVDEAEKYSGKPEKVILLCVSILEE